MNVDATIRSIDFGEVEVYSTAKHKDKKNFLYKTKGLYMIKDVTDFSIELLCEKEANKK